jgi:hypothetical protein
MFKAFKPFKCSNSMNEIAKRSVERSKAVERLERFELRAQR